jgi:3-methyladenine DNA glycosylase Tag
MFLIPVVVLIAVGLISFENSGKRSQSFYEYKLLEGTNLNALQDEVNKAIKNGGWTLVGGVSAYPYTEVNGSVNGHYVQAIAR